jgi:hypothetical protein
LAIVLKETLQGIDASNNKELKSKILASFWDIPSDEPKSHSIN